MLQTLGYVSEECNKWGMPLLAIMYPRGETAYGEDDNHLDLKKNKPEEYAKLVRHAARVGVELGADIVKTQYTGSTKTFKTVVDGCKPVPVIIAGGPQVSDEKILGNIYGAIQAGGAGICMGRNSFHRENTAAFVKAVREIVHYNKNVELRSTNWKQNVGYHR